MNSCLKMERWNLNWPIKPIYMILLKAKYTGLMLKFEFSIRLIWTLLLSFVPTK